jgi:GDPmannose 4,6-dehydratase
LICGFDIAWQGEDENEVGIDKKTGKIIVKVNPVFYRPAEVELLVGNAEKAKTVLGWKAKTSYKELCQMMMQADIDRISR